MGGSVSTLSFEDTTTKNQLTLRRRRGGGIRDRVRGFSRESRINLLRRLASINRDTFKASKGRMVFVTLTYPHKFPQDPEPCKRHLKVFRKRLQREYGPFAAFWRLGIQGRGAWHFHILLFVGPSFGTIDQLRRFISSSWYEISTIKGDFSTPSAENVDRLLLGMNRIRQQDPGYYRMLRQRLLEGLKAEPGGEE